MTYVSSASIRALTRALSAALGLPLLIGGCSASVECENAVDQAGGTRRCASGLITRPSPATCESSLPRDGTCAQDSAADACSTDADCTDYPNGMCNSSSGFDGLGCYCSYGCTKDADCGTGSICACGEVIGHCEPAGCVTDADCGDGSLCARYESLDLACGSQGWECTTPQDECLVHEDCLNGMECVYAVDHRVCQESNPCAIGRPFLVDEAPRLAPAVRGERAWASGPAPEIASIPPDLRASLAQRWTEIGLMEHASVAAFARFALQLLALGAPPELLEKTTAAMQDETRHARVAFALASAYAGEAIGPGPLAIDGALRGGADPVDVLRTVFREGCIGETVAAIEAKEGALAAADPVLGAVLAGIGEDETSHAALAWAAVRFLALAMGDAAGEVLIEELARAEAERAPRPDAEPEPLADHGLFGETRRAAIRSVIVTRVVAPATRALVASLTPTSAEAA